jgi:hypothetical protein
MQSTRPIFLVNLLFFFLIVFQPVYSQGVTNSLLKADSLFESRSYKEAFEIYSENYQEGLYSPAMLLKMAFIAEGMGDKEQATHYLGKYYDLNPNEQIISKIKTLTGQTTLFGYEVDDRDRFVLFLVNYKQYLLIALSAILLLSVIMIFWTSRKNESRVSYWPTAALMILIFLVNNFLDKPSTGLITHSPTYITTHPSAGGELVDQIEPGHRVKIKSSKDIWFEVEWKNQRAYIRKDHITRL